MLAAKMATLTPEMIRHETGLFGETWCTERCAPIAADNHAVILRKIPVEPDFRITGASNVAVLIVTP